MRRKMGCSSWSGMKVRSTMVMCFMTLSILLVCLKEYRTTINSSSMLFAALTNQSTKTEWGTGKSSSSSSSMLASMLADDDGVLLSAPELFKSESICLSRRESRLYRNHSRTYEPSAYLVSKMRRYEELHRRCGHHTDGYNRTINDIILPYINKKTKQQQQPGAAGKEEEEEEETTTTVNMGAAGCDYLVWYPFSGLGNRMISLASAFLYALLTDRVLLVDFGPDMIDLFCEPFPYSSWLLPDNFPISGKLLRNQPLLLETFQSTMARLQANRWASPDDLNLNLPPALHVYLEHGGGKTRFFHCDESHIQVLRKIPVLILASDVYFAPSLFITPSFSDELTKMFPDDHNHHHHHHHMFPIFHHLGGAYLFFPSNQAWTQITHYYDTNLAKADVRVGLQIRIFNPKQYTHKDVLDQILACTTHKDVNVLPPIINPNTTTTTTTTNTSTTTTTTTTTTNTSTTAILVASLYSEYGNWLRQIYYGSSSTSSVYQPSQEGSQRFQDKNQNMKAWVEMYLLSMCDHLLTSGQSTFGYVAQGIGGLNPWVLSLSHSPSPSCYRASTVDPCYHAPPKFNCQTKGGVPQVTRIFPNIIQPCEDVSDGIRLGSPPRTTL